MKHSFNRIIVLFTAFILSFLASYAMFVVLLLFYCVWSLWLLIEAMMLHREKQINKRNQNLVLIMVIPVIFGLQYLYFEIFN